ncbi:exo-poly-alpha-D-galacturonosidase [Capsulimonas corticalis]|uniref:Exo-poly-alpha-D-galacturonosidase n=1 Tax=Capsulimonas corticalis TaxID=2219043 RepID=A0A402D5Y7_9BACT|nr:right-handed parallel beta-helix repeat-containing protein [Capsulimonas corticalis]BDI32508.1 exo-poly-alpha-D-galacturonosidase [Capsulimonas corticalis]
MMHLGKRLLLAGVLSCVAAPIVRADTPAAPVNGVFDVHAFGAKGDGQTLDTEAIDKAIAAASAAGGGTVRLTAGTYPTTTVHLQSNVTLEIAAGATLLAATPGNGVAYDAPEDNPTAGQYQDFGHTHWRNSLIWGENLHDVAIVGTGRIWGRGLVKDETKQSGDGNKAIALKLCRNVTLRDFTIAHGGWFGILATGVDNLTISGLRIDTNRDGMDIDACRVVHVSDCTVNSPHDDGICLKSSYGLGFNRGTENVTITNCVVSGYEEGSVLDGTFSRAHDGGTGRIKFGTESNGGFKNITVSNCVFSYCHGLALEEVDGGSLEDVSISNLTMRDIVNAPIFVRLGGRQRAPAGTPMGTVRRVSISHITVYNAAATSSVIVAGVPGAPVQDLSLSDIRIWYKGGGTAAQATRTPPEDVAGYPEPNRFGVLPAYGVYLRHVQGITVDGLQTHTQTPDQRPALVLDDVSGARFTGLDAEHAASIPIFSLKSVTGLQLRDVQGLPDSRQDHPADGHL